MCLNLIAAHQIDITTHSWKFEISGLMTSRRFLSTSSVLPPNPPLFFLSYGHTVYFPFFNGVFNDVILLSTQGCNLHIVCLSIHLSNKYLRHNSLTPVCQALFQCLEKQKWNELPLSHLFLFIIIIFLNRKKNWYFRREETCTQNI